MNKITTTIVATLATITVSFGQITTSKIAPKIELTDNTPYDSTENFLGKAFNKYVGQELYLKGMSDGIRNYGYEGFLLNYTQDGLVNNKNIYKCCERNNSKYAELAGKYFKVLEIIKHPKAEESEYLYGKKSFFKLQEKESKDIVYYLYDSDFEHSFPFIVVGYFTKLKQTQIGKKFVLRGRNWVAGGTMAMTDMNTGKPVSYFESGNIWKCVDVTIEEKYYSLSLVIQNEKGEQIPLGVDNSEKDYWVFEATLAERLNKQYGLENWQKIVAGKINIGMTTEMCLLSWGEPKKINETITAGKKSEQWIYADSYIYLTNGVVSAIQ